MPQKTTDGGSNQNNARVPFQNLFKTTMGQNDLQIADGDLSVRQWMSHLINNVEEEEFLGDVL